jgi:hypothetical protein
MVESGTGNGLPAGRLISSGDPWGPGAVIVVGSREWAGNAGNVLIEARISSGRRERGRAERDGHHPAPPEQTIERLMRHTDEGPPTESNASLLDISRRI